MARYTHVFDLCFEISTDLDEDEIFDKENLAAFLKAARQRLVNIELLKNTEGFGLVDTYENDFIGFCESFRDLNIVNRST